MPARPSTAAVRLLTGFKEPVRLATTANIALSGLFSIDGTTPKAGERILVKNQTNATQNGIYVASEGEWRRAPDANTERTLQAGMMVLVREGVVSAGVVYKLATTVENLGSDNITWSYFISSTVIDYFTSIANDIIATAYAIGGAAQYASRAVAIATTVPAALLFLQTAGYATAGDGGGALYARVGSAPSHAGYFQSADGAYWELAQKDVFPEMFGGKRDGTLSHAAFQNAINYLSAKWGGGRVLTYPGIYDIGQSLVGATGVSLIGPGRSLSAIRIPQVATAGGGMSSHILQYLGKSAFEISGIQFIGNRAVSNASTGFAGLYIASACSSFTVRDISVVNVEGDAIVIADECQIGDVTRCYVYNAKNGINLFKGNVGIHITHNRVDFMQLNGIMSDDATTADTTIATAKPNVNCWIDDNYVSRASQGGNSHGIAVSGQLGGSMSRNVAASIGVNGADVPSSKSGGGFVVNSGQDNYYAAIGVACVDNLAYDIAGGAALTVQGAHRCDFRGLKAHLLFQWPTSLAGAAINILQDVLGPNGLAIKGTHSNMFGGGAIQGSVGTDYAVQLGASTQDSRIGDIPYQSLDVAFANVSATAAAGQILWRGHGGAPPTWSAAWEGALHYDTSDHKLKVATNSAWVVAGTQT